MKLGKIRLRVLVFAAVTFFSPAVAAAHPGSGIVVARDGSVYFLDTATGVWRVDPSGILSKLGGPLFHWMAIDNTGAFSRTALPSGSGGDVERVGQNPTLIVSSDFPIAIGPNGSLYYPSRGAGPLRILQLTPAGVTSTLAVLPAGGPRDINGITVAPDGSVYYTESSSVNRITHDGRIARVVDNVVLTDCSPPPGDAPNDPYLRGLAVDSAGTIYVAANGCGSVLRVTRDGKRTVIVQLRSPWSPTAVAVSHGSVYALEYLHTLEERRVLWLPRVRKIGADGRSTIIATVHR